MLGVTSPHELKHGRKIQQNFVLEERLKECVLGTRKGARAQGRKPHQGAKVGCAKA